MRSNQRSNIFAFPLKHLLTWDFQAEETGNVLMFTFSERNMTLEAVVQATITDFG